MRCRQVKSIRSILKQNYLPDKLDGLVTSSEDGLARYEEGRLPSVALFHHQNHVEELVEHPPQGLDDTADKIH